MPEGLCGLSHIEGSKSQPSINCEDRTCDVAVLRVHIIWVPYSSEETAGTLCSAVRSEGNIKYR